MIKTPKFWSSINIFSTMLYPFSLLYKAASHLCYSCSTRKNFATKIICVGNAITGGSGKTPSVKMLAQALQKKGYNIALVCKNYKAQIKGPIKVTQKHTSPEVVDEAILLSKIADTFTAQNIIDAISMADKEGYDFIITDDGLQNNHFHKDISILVINGEIGVGNNLCLPAGPLREPLKKALKKSDYVFFVGEDKHNLQRFIPKEKLLPVEKNVHSTPSKKSKYTAFTGIAYPELFFKTLESNGYKITSRIPFPDHHLYSEHDLKNLIKTADKDNSKLITTEKDFTKIAQSYHCKIEVLPIEFKSSGIDSVTSKLAKV